MTINALIVTLPNLHLGAGNRFAIDIRDHAAHPGLLTLSIVGAAVFQQIGIGILQRLIGIKRAFGLRRSAAARRLGLRGAQQQGGQRNTDSQDGRKAQGMPAGLRGCHGSLPDKAQVKGTSINSPQFLSSLSHPETL